MPRDFRFSVKIPKTVTHQRKLIDCGDLLGEFMAQAQELGDKLAVLLVQLPPKLAFDPGVAAAFFTDLSSRSDTRIACEPRHSSWFSDEAEQLLKDLRVSRVAADPAICEAAARPGGWRSLEYWRLHGSPVIYRSSYADRIGEYAALLPSSDAPASWCIFDNTASSAGAGDALALMKALS